MRLIGSRVGLSPATRQCYQTLAVQRSCQLKDLHALAVDSFIASRVAAMQGGSSYSYAVIPRQFESQNVRLAAPLYDKVQSVSQLDGVSVRVFLYNALTAYVDALRTSDP